MQRKFPSSVYVCVCEREREKEREYVCEREHSKEHGDFCSVKKYSADIEHNFTAIVKHMYYSNIHIHPDIAILCIKG